MNEGRGFAGFHGFLQIDKPEGITSQDVITRMQAALASAFGVKKRDLPKMGHGGTLDPFATGLLLVAVGDGVKLTRYLLGSDKAYVAEIEFGARTASGDRTNEVVERTERLPRDRETLARAAASFLEEPYLQTPPMYSAKKVDGTRLYELARKGIEVERAAIACRVSEFQVLDTKPSAACDGIGTAVFSARVSSGTFIRTLAEDWAKRMESLGHLTALRRTAAGRFALAGATPLADLESRMARGEISGALPGFIPFHRAILGTLPRFEIPTEIARKVFAGETRTLAELPIPPGDVRSSVALYADDHLVAIVREAEGGTPRTIERAFPLRFGDVV